MKIGDRIKIARENLGLSQEQLAIRLGYSTRTTISRIESGSNGVPTKKLVAFAEALRVTPQWLAGWADSEDVIMSQNPEAQSEACLRYLSDNNIKVSPEKDPDLVFLSDEDIEQTWFVFNAETGQSTTLTDAEYRQRYELLLQVAKELFSTTGPTDEQIYLHQYVGALTTREQRPLAAAVRSILSQRE